MNQSTMNLESASGELSESLDPFLEPEIFVRDQRIFGEGDAADCAYFIDHGSVRIELEREELDSDSVLGFVGAGELLGELGLLDGNPRSASAYAEEEVKAVAS